MKRKIVSKNRRKNFEIRFYEGLIARSPDFIQALSCLGDVYTSKGLHQEGLVIDKKLAGLRPEDPIVRYNLACSLSLLGDIPGSLKELKKAVLLGYDDFSYIIEDEDLQNLRDDELFADFLAKLKKIKHPRRTKSK